MTDDKRCKHTKANGDRCGAYAVNGSVFCIAHDPDSRDTFKAAQRKGAARAGRKRKVGTIAELVGMELDVTDRIELGNHAQLKQQIEWLYTICYHGDATTSRIRLMKDLLMAAKELHVEQELIDQWQGQVAEIEERLAHGTQ